MNATQKITAADISEAGIWSEGTPWNAQEIVALYRDYLGETSEPKGMAGFYSKLDTTFGIELKNF